MRLVKKIEMNSWLAFLRRGRNWKFRAEPRGRRHRRSADTRAKPGFRRTKKRQIMAAGATATISQEALRRQHPIGERQKNIDNEEPTHSTID